MECVEKFDGMFIVSTNWKVIKQLQPLYIKRPLVFNTRKVSVYKGVTVFPHKWVHRATICYMSGFGCTVVINNEIRQPLWSAMIAKLEIALCKAAFSLPQTSTETAWIPSNVIPAGERLQRVVHMEDIEAFGRELYRELRLQFRQDTNVVKYVFFSTGQNIAVDSILHTLQEMLNFEEMNEIVVHFAGDVSLPQHALHVKPDTDIVKQLPNKVEYAPLGMKKRVNFYGMVQDRPTDTDIHLRGVKIYSELFKQVHNFDINNPYFSKEEVASLLFKTQGFKPLTAKERKTIEKIKHKCSTFITFLGSVLRTSKFYARHEFIYSKRSPSATTVMEFLHDFRIKRSRFNLCSNETYISTPVEEIRLRIMRVCFPAVVLVKSEIERRLEFVNDAYTISVDDCVSVQAAEAVLSFMLYGIASTTRGSFDTTYRHNNELCKELGLVPRNVAKGDDVCLRIYYKCIADDLSFRYTTRSIPIIRSLYGKNATCFDLAEASRNAQNENISDEFITTLVNVILFCGAEIGMNYKGPATFPLSVTHEIPVTFSSSVLSALQFVRKVCMGTNTTLKFDAVLKVMKLHATPQYWEVIQSKMAIALNRRMLHESTFIVFPLHILLNIQTAVICPFGACYEHHFGIDDLAIRVGKIATSLMQWYKATVQGPSTEFGSTLYSIGGGHQWVVFQRCVSDYERHKPLSNSSEDFFVMIEYYLKQVANWKTINFQI